MLVKVNMHLDGDSFSTVLSLLEILSKELSPPTSQSKTLA